MQQLVLLLLLEFPLQIMLLLVFPLVFPLQKNDVDV